MTSNVKIVILGDGGVGKTALSLRLSLNFFVEVSRRDFTDSSKARRNGN